MTVSLAPHTPGGHPTRPSVRECPDLDGIPDGHAEVSGQGLRQDRSRRARLSGWSYGRTPLMLAVLEGTVACG
jgi:hypothetical protein